MPLRAGLGHNSVWDGTPLNRLRSPLALLGCALLALGCTGEISSPSGSAPLAPTTNGGQASIGSTPATCNGPVTLAPPRIWRLTHAQLANTLRDAFAFVPPAAANFPPESRLEGFANRSAELKISPLLADAYYQAGEELAGQALTAPASFGINCAVADLKAGECLRTFITTTAEKMWRRPLTDAEITSFEGLFATTAAQGDGPSGGVKAVIQALFLSPSFLHRSELGSSQQAGTATTLTDYELASVLSYTLWESAPDAALLAQAKQGKLADQAVLATEAKRLLAAHDKASPAFNHFMQQWLFIEGLAGSEKDEANFPLGTMEAAQASADENRLFIDSVLFAPEGQRSFKTLLTGSYGFVNALNAPLYGITGVTGTNLVRTELDRTQRRGILSQPAFMWAHATSEGTSLVERGSYLRAELLCDRVPPPPGGVQQAPMFAAEDATGREKFTLHSQPACVGCHEMFDSLGFAMESYDAIGRFRTTDKNKPIDPSGKVPLPSRPDGPKLEFSNFVDLIDKLAETPDVYQCFSSQYLTYASGRGAESLDACERKNIADQFQKSNYQVDSLILSVISSPTFAKRQN